MYEDINPFDEAPESTATVTDAPVEEKSEPEVSNVDSVTETTKPDSTDVSIVEKGEGDAKVSEPAEAKEPEKTIQEVIADVDKEIDDKKHPEYYRNGLKTIKSAFLKETDSVIKQYEPLKPFGDVEKVVNDLEILKGLEAVVVNPTTNLPEKTVAPFVSKLIETRGIETGVKVMMELGQQPSPATPGLNLVQELVKSIGLDPTRIEDYKKFAANGYRAESQLPDPAELAAIPERLREAYLSLSETRREKLMPYNGESEEEIQAREEELADRQAVLDRQRMEAESEKQEAERKQAEEIKAKQDFYTDLDVQTLAVAEESGSRLTNTFVETLVKDANLDKREALGITLLINSAINGTGTEGKLSLELLKEEGITLDSKLTDLFKDWNTECRNAAYYKKIGNEAELKSAQARLSSLEDEMCRKANPVVAHFAEKTAESKKARIEKKNALLTQTQKYNNGIQPNEGVSKTIGTGQEEISPAQREAALSNPFG